MRLVIDMNLSIDWVAALQEQGVAAVHWSSVGSEDAADETIMDWARANQAIVLTRDLDFGIALTRQALIDPSVIQLRCDQVRLERHAPLVGQVLTEHAVHLDAGAIVTLDNERVRVRILDRDPTL